MILVTGGTGLLGSHLLLDLLLKGEKVRVLKRKSSSLQNLQLVFKEVERISLLKQIEWAEGDVLDVFSVEDAMKGITEVYHCAAVVAFTKAEEANMMLVNVEGTTNVVNECLRSGVKKLCHVSSIASLGRTRNGTVLSEETQWTNSEENTAYAISKYSSEREVWRGIAEGLDAVIVNPSVIIGPGPWSNSSAKLFPLVWKGLKFYSEGVNGFVDVRDVSKAMIALMESEIKNERFIVSSENLSYQDLFIFISKSLNKKPPFIRVTPMISALAWRAAAIKGFITGTSPLITKETARTALGKYYYSNEKIVRQTGIKFRKVEEAVRRTGELFLKAHSI